LGFAAPRAGSDALRFGKLDDKRCLPGVTAGVRNQAANGMRALREAVRAALSRRARGKAGQGLRA